MTRTRATALATGALALVVASSCKQEKAREIPRPDRVCPGDPSCPDTGEAVLRAGAAELDVTPVITDWQTVDADGNWDFDPYPLGDDEWHDGDGDGEWDFVFMAGLDSPRPARDVHDPIMASALVLEWKSTTVAIVTLDVIGYFLGDVDIIRESVADLDIDHVIVSASHSHEGPDTVGIWGIDDAWAGWRQDVYDTINEGAEQAIREARASLAPAQVTYNQVAADSHPRNGLCNVQWDGRDPVIFDEYLTVLHFENRDTGVSIATLVNFTFHPEASGDDHQSLSADFVHWLRLGIEEGIDRGDTHMEGLGGQAMFVQGPLGSQIGPGRITCEDLDGTVHEESGFPRAECVGWNLAKIALEAVESGDGPETDVPIEVRATRFDVPVENYGYHAMMLGHVFHRYDMHGYDDSLPVNQENMPWIWTEVSWLRIGRAQALGIGGEPNPELFIGGYDGSHTPQCAIDRLDLDMENLSKPDNENPPDLSLAPGPPYLFDRMDADYPMAWGTTNDFIGYLVPTYNYQLASPGAYVTEAPGEHYEETNSVGPGTWPKMEQVLVDMLEWKP